jgi:hypothetical protein
MGNHLGKVASLRFAKDLTLALGVLAIAALPLCATTQGFSVPDDVALRIRLDVDLFDAKTKNLVWRGSATDTLSNNSDKNIKKLKSSVQKLFEHFPPQQKSH